MLRFVAVCLGAGLILGGGAVRILAADPTPTPAPSKFEMATTGTKKAEGFSQEKMWSVYYKDQQILVDLKNSQLNQDFIVLTSIARGVSANFVIGGMTWGDDVLWSFRKVGDKMHVVRKNVRFKAKAGTPEASAVKMAYGDSVLYALPIITETPGGNLVDMTRIFFSDDEMVGRMLNASFVMDRSTVGKIKSFRDNCEIQIAAVYSLNNPFVPPPDTVVDPRGMQVTVHYSISQLPNTSYRPRKADDRIGYFLTATKDFSDDSDDQHFVRYITRWDLQKADPAAKLSPPKQPIKFWIEKTLPVKLRPIVRSGILEWNKAYEKLGYDNAVEVEQQPDDAEWDPEDVNYNTFRWITAEAGFAMGPSRVNPLTGQILDADIIFDASFLRYWKQEYENFTPSAIAALAGDDHPVQALPFLPFANDRGRQLGCRFSSGMQQQMGFAAAVLSAGGQLQKRGELPEEFLMQALKEVVMHEVGHTLGLRHNFKASTWKTMAEIEDPAKANEPIVASVMDYSPVNVVTAGAKQTSYYTSTIGPYDYWAIEYGYKPISGDEPGELAKIAARSGEPGLDYATDEDTRGTFDPDPLSNRFDLGKDSLVYSQRQMTTASALIPKILDRSVDTGEGFQRARQAFGLLFREYWRTAFFTARFPGGVYVHRDHKGDNQARTPFKPVEAAQQRAAMKLLTDTVLAPMTFDPNLLNSLSASRWNHWGMRDTVRLDYPIHETMTSMQSQLVSMLLSPTKLSRLQDGELKSPANEDVYTLAEHLRTLTGVIFKEINEPAAGEFTNRTPYIGSFRRSLQRTTLRSLNDIVIAGAGYPEDARVVTRMLLTELNGKLDAALQKGDLKLDDYSKAHLLDAQKRIKQVLEASISVTVPAGVAN